VKLELERRALRFKRPLQTSYDELCERELIAVSLTGDDGIAGYGEAAPLPWAFGSMTAWLLLTWLTLPLAAGVLRTVRTRSDGPALNRALARTGLLQLVFCLLFAAGIIASGGIAP